MYEKAATAGGENSFTQTPAVLKFSFIKGSDSSLGAIKEGSMGTLSIKYSLQSGDFFMILFSRVNVELWRYKSMKQGAPIHLWMI